MVCRDLLRRHFSYVFMEDTPNLGVSPRCVYGGHLQCGRFACAWLWGTPPQAFRLYEFTEISPKAFCLCDLWRTPPKAYCLYELTEISPKAFCLTEFTVNFHRRHFASMGLWRFSSKAIRPYEYTEISPKAICLYGFYGDSRQRYLPLCIGFCGEFSPKAFASFMGFVVISPILSSIFANIKCLKVLNTVGLKANSLKRHWDVKTSEAYKPDDGPATRRLAAVGPGCPVASRGN